MWEDLAAAGWRVSVNTVAASMARQGLQGRPPRRKRRSLTRPDKAAAPIPDLIKRDFSATAVNERWCGDLTEIPTEEAKLYLATVEDLASRRLPGFAIGEHHDAALAKAALCMAAAVRGGDIAGVIFHSDKGGEYTGDVFAGACAALGVVQSMAGSARRWTTRRPKVSTRPSSSSCCRAGTLPARMPPAGRSPATSTAITTAADTAPPGCSRRSPTKPSSPNEQPPPTNEAKRRETGPQIAQEARKGFG